MSDLMFILSVLSLQFNNLFIELECISHNIAQLINMFL